MRRSIFVLVIVLFAMIGAPPAGARPLDQGGQVAPNAASLGEILSFNAVNYSGAEEVSHRYPPVVIGDSLISPIWDSVPSYPISSYGEKGLISSVHLGSQVYFKIQYDITIEWVALQWDSDNSSDPENFQDADMEPMAAGDDMWVFGQTKETGVYGDGASLGTAPPFLEQDAKGDLVWESVMLNDTDGTPISMILEVGRSFDTQDLLGNDVIFSPDFNVSVYFASAEKHRPDSSVSQAKFVISDIGLGGNVTLAQPETEEVEEVKNLVIPYIFYNLGAGIFFMAVLYAIVVYISVRAVSKEV